MNHRSTLLPFKRTLKPVVLLIQLALCSGMAIAAQSVPATNTVQTISYRIAAGDLAQVLNQFAVQSGIALSTEGTKLQGLKSQGISGNYSIEQGFQILLSGTHFQVVKSGAGYILLEKSKSPQQVRNMGQLNQIDIHTQGQGVASNITQLPVITVHAESADGSADHGYVTKQLKQVGPWGAKALQDTPYSISVMSEELIANSIARDLDQVYKMNPVVQTLAPTTVWGYPAVNIRGFQSSTGIFDGLKLSSYSYGLNTEEIERVEIMNGLTGFMYGAGNVGGTANYVLKRPTYEKMANVTLGNYGNEQWFAHLDLGNKIDEEGRFAYRLNAAYSDGETSKQDQQLEKYLLSGALDWNATEHLLVQLEAAHSYWHIDRPDNRFYTSGLSYWPRAFDNELTFSPGWTYNQIESDRIGLNTTWDINDSFTLRTSYLYKQDNREFVIIYPIYTQTGWTMYDPSKTSPYDTISQGAYIYLDSKFNTGNIRHKLTVGVSGDTYKENKFRTTSLRDPNYTTPTNLTDDQLMNLVSPNFPSASGPRFKASETTNKNIIIGDDITFNEQWGALVGFNYTSVGVDSFEYTVSSYEESALTPTLSLIYKPFASLTTYASYIEGLEQGGSVPNDENVYNNPGAVLDPYISKQYELGAKYAIAENLLLSSALFRIEKANSYDETTANGKITRNQDGLQVHQGIELTLTGKLTDQLTVMAGGTVMDLGVDKATNKNLEGKKPIGTAGNMAKIYAEYHVPEVEGLTFTGGAYFTGKKYKDALNTQEIESFTIFDAGVRYKTRIAEYPTTFNLNFTNITDKNYWASHWQPGMPRNVAFSVKTEF